MLDKIYYRLVRRQITAKDEQNQYSGGWWPRLVREAAAGLYAGETGRMVELGCGEGLFLAKLATANPRADLYGLDLSEDLLEQAKTRLTGHLNMHLSPGNALRTDFPDAFFDHCFCLNVIINLPGLSSVEQLFSEVHRILKPGGTFIFDFRNALSPIIQLQYRLARFYDTGLSVPLRAYLPRTASRIARRHDLEPKSRIPLGIPKNLFAPAMLFVVEKK